MQHTQHTHIHTHLSPPPQAILRLKASMLDVRDSQSPNHLWRLCTVPGADPWHAKISLGALLSNILLSQAPRRKLKVWGGVWVGGGRLELWQGRVGQ